MKFLVGFKGSLWSGGAFQATAQTPEQAAAKVYAHAASGFPKGDRIIAARLTSTTPFGAYHLDLVGKDPSKPESWKLDPQQSHLPKRGRK